MKWEGVCHYNNKEGFSAIIDRFKSLRKALSSKEPVQSRKLFDECLPAMTILKEEMKNVQKIALDTLKYVDPYIQLSGRVTC